MENERWATSSGVKVNTGHLKSSSKVISKYRCDLTKNFDQVCVWYHWKGYLSVGVLQIDIEMLVTNQGHLKR